MKITKNKDFNKITFCYIDFKQSSCILESYFDILKDMYLTRCDEDYLLIVCLDTLNSMKGNKYFIWLLRNDLNFIATAIMSKSDCVNHLVDSFESNIVTED